LILALVLLRLEARLAAGNMWTNSVLIINPPLLRSRRDKESKSMQTKTNRKSGFTLVEIMIVVAIIGLLAAIAIPNFIRARTKSQQNACINNLRQVDGAIQQWALETKQASDAAVDASGSEIEPYLGRGAAGSLSSVFCPSDSAATFVTSYEVVDVATAPACLINGDGSADADTPHVLDAVAAPAPAPAP
jgi:prepilin-type N-terminal cleavage/methylation domain-containing protein